VASISSAVVSVILGILILVPLNSIPQSLYAFLFVSLLPFPSSFTSLSSMRVSHAADMLFDGEKILMDAIDLQTSVANVLTCAARQLAADNFALIRCYPHPLKPYIITSDIPDFDVNQLTPDIIATDSFKFSTPTTFDTIHQIIQISAFNINSNTRLLMFFSSLQNRFPDELIHFLTSIIPFILKQCPYDVDYLFNRIASRLQNHPTNLLSSTFSFTNLNDDEIFEIVVEIFQSLDLINHLNINKFIFINLLITIRKSYNPVPYHNWIHAVNVVQFVFIVINKAHVNTYLNEHEIFALLIAAVAHDIDHDGRNNTFHRKTQTILAQLATPSLPPLELHHASLIMNIIKLRCPTMFMTWSSAEIRTFETFVISSILATDMEQHRGLIDQFKLMKSEFDESKENHRLMLCQIILKCADLSNVARRFEEAKDMTERLMEEYFEQGDIENELGLDISPMCDRHKCVPIPVGQIGFYNFVAGPLISELCSFFDGLTDIDHQYHSNLSMWLSLKERLIPTE
jgi:hypothetical protein